MAATMQSGALASGAVLVQADVRRPADHAARRLMAAILEDAIDIYRTRRTRGRGGRRLITETERWFASENRKWPFSYRNVCDALDIDGVALRHRLLRERMVLVKGGGGAGAARSAET